MVSDISAITFADVFKIPQYGDTHCIDYELKHNKDYNAVIRICSNTAIHPKDYSTYEQIKKGISQGKIYHIDVKTFLFSDKSTSKLKHDDTRFERAFPDETVFVILDILYSEIIRKNQEFNLNKK